MHLGQLPTDVIKRSTQTTMAGKEIWWNHETKKPVPSLVDLWAVNLATSCHRCKSKRLRRMYKHFSKSHTLLLLRIVQRWHAPVADQNDSHTPEKERHHTYHKEQRARRRPSHKHMLVNSTPNAQRTSQTQHGRGTPNVPQNTNATLRNRSRQHLCTTRRKKRCSAWGSTFKLILSNPALLPEARVILCIWYFTPM